MPPSYHEGQLQKGGFHLGSRGCFKTDFKDICSFFWSHGCPLAIQNVVLQGVMVKMTTKQQNSEDEFKICFIEVSAVLAYLQNKIKQLKRTVYQPLTDANLTTGNTTPRCFSCWDCQLALTTATTSNVKAPGNSVNHPRTEFPVVRLQLVWEFVSGPCSVYLEAGCSWGNTVNREIQQSSWRKLWCVKTEHKNTWGRTKSMGRCKFSLIRSVELWSKSLAA